MYSPQGPQWSSLDKSIFRFIFVSQWSILHLPNTFFSSFKNRLTIFNICSLLLSKKKDEFQFFTSVDGVLNRRPKWCQPCHRQCEVGICLFPCFEYSIDYFCSCCIACCKAIQWCQKECSNKWNDEVLLEDRQ